jgi:Zn-dependent peptidase ImmA (M78 family)
MSSTSAADAQELADRLRAGIDPAVLSTLTSRPLEGVKQLGIKIAYRAEVRHAHCGVDGSHLPGSNKIVVATSASIPRRHFTALHETGHYLIHHDDDIADVIDMAERGPELEEAVCNQFAADVLIPPELVDELVPAAGPCAEHVMALHKKTQASRSACCAAVARKLQGAGYVLVAESDGTVFFAAPTAKQYVIAPRTPQAPGGLLARAGATGRARDPDRVVYASGVTSPWFHLDAVRDHDGWVFAVLTNSGSPPWGGLGILPDDGPIARETVECPHCEEQFDAWRAPCKQCGDYRCPKCRKCLCDVAETVVCTECWLTKNPATVIEQGPPRPPRRPCATDARARRAGPPPARRSPRPHRSARRAADTPGRLFSRPARASSHQAGAITMSMPTTLRRVLVRLVCGRCRHTWQLCVPVAAAVPGPLRCSPSGSPAAGSGAPSGLLCPRCGGPCSMTDDDLRRRVEEELRRGRDRHVSTGAVVIDCR